MHSGVVGRELIIASTYNKKGSQFDIAVFDLSKAKVSKPKGCISTRLARAPLEIW